jgi:hypothetical protein
LKALGDVLASQGKIKEALAKVGSESRAGIVSAYRTASSRELNRYAQCAQLLW